MSPGGPPWYTVSLHLPLLMHQNTPMAFESPSSQPPNSYVQQNSHVCMWCQNKISVYAIKNQLLLAACPNQSQQGARQVACFHQTLESLSNHSAYSHQENKTSILYQPVGMAPWFGSKARDEVVLRHKRCGEDSAFPQTTPGRRDYKQC